MKRFIFTLIATSLLSINLLTAQNPFKEFGYEVKVMTLSKGKYIEFIPYDSIQHIGLLYNCIIIKKVIPVSSLDTGTKQKLDKIYKISKIDSLENVYLIYAKSNDSIFKIVSQKLVLPDCKPIQLGESYNLKIISAFPENFSQKRDKYGIKMYNTLIKLKKGIVWDLFVTENLKGLCYIPSANEDNKK
jgi:hypothetical protein